MSNRIKEYHKWLLVRARKQWHFTEDLFAAAQKNPSMSNADVDYHREVAHAAYEVYAFVELSDPANYAAHKRDKKTRKEQGL